jgi:hypothetical protein
LDGLVEIFDTDVQVKTLHARFLFGRMVSVAGTPQDGPQSLSAKPQQLSVRNPMSSFMRGKIGL